MSNISAVPVGGKIYTKKYNNLTIYTITRKSKTIATTTGGFRFRLKDGFMLGNDVFLMHANPLTKEIEAASDLQTRVNRANAKLAMVRANEKNLELVENFVSLMDNQELQ